ncbi:MAG: hypothetical protein LBR90_03960, partial [Elusimicrobiota bacterium]|nr:hypothetical protein [Elusimicrobiota bacterium]
DGFVIGVALSSLKGSDNQNLNFAIPSNYLMRLMLDNNYTPYTESSAAQAAPQMPQDNQYLDAVANHFKKSWKILKYRILKLNP